MGQGGPGHRAGEGEGGVYGQWAPAVVGRHVFALPVFNDILAIDIYWYATNLIPG